MNGSLESEIEQLAREILRNLSSFRIDLFDKRERGRYSKERVEKLLQKSKDRGEIVDFLPASRYRRRRRIVISDFLISLVKGNKRILIGLKVKSSQVGADRYRQRQRRMKKIVGRDFIEVPVLVAGPQKSDQQLERDWRKILIHFRKS
jgi:hypothetical protein